MPYGCHSERSEESALFCTAGSKADSSARQRPPSFGMTTIESFSAASSVIGGRPVSGAVDLPYGAEMICQMRGAGDDSIHLDLVELARRSQRNRPLRGFFAQTLAKRLPFALRDGIATPACFVIGARERIFLSRTPSVQQTEAIAEMIHMSCDGSAAAGRRQRG